VKTNLRHAASVTCCICTFLFPNKSSAVAEMGDRSATIDIGRKERAAACMLSSGVAGSRVEVYLRTKWHDLDPSLPFGHKGMGRKVGVLCPFLGGAGSPSNNTMSPGPRTSVPSGILIHPGVWHFGLNRHGRKLGCCSQFGGAGTPSNTMSSGLRFRIHPYANKVASNSFSRLATTDMGRKLGAVPV